MDFKNNVSLPRKNINRILSSVPESESHFSKNMIGVFKDKFCGLANNDLVKITRFSDQTQHQQNDYESSGSIFGQQIKLFERSDSKIFMNLSVRIA